MKQSNLFVKMNSSYFDWLKWRAGSPLDFKIQCREELLISKTTILRSYAIGWCDGESLICRPKIKHKGVMFYLNNVYFWFHFRNNEFERIFNNEA